MAQKQSQPFLRVPPFPNRRVSSLAQPGSSKTDPDALAAALCSQRVGGSFWGAAPALTMGHKLVLAPDSAAQLKLMLAQLGDRTASVVVSSATALPRGQTRIAPGCDPWQLAAQAGEIWAGADQDIALVAGLSGTQLRLFGTGSFSGCDTDPVSVAVRHIGTWRYINPFNGSDWSPLEVIALLGAWRRQIDANRAIDAVYGVAGWKRVTLDAMLWDGTGPVRHTRSPVPAAGRSTRVAIWKSRTPPRLLRKLEASGARLGEIEDGFIRSSGLGANCVPPLSAIVDFAGVYFDPTGASDLELILEGADIDTALCKRAAALRVKLVQAAISKYEQGASEAIRTDNSGRRVLVTGQVEDDRSMLSGGAGLSNLEVLSRARQLEPDAWIVYKPHPDVEAGHRKGRVQTSEVLRFANEISTSRSIVSLIDSVDALHVITSLAGFEALLRGKHVTTHGMPFYAGWGLTRDLAALPVRRTRRRSLDELVAATLLLYPRYLDPVTRLPCSAEIVVERMAQGKARVASPLIFLRQWQGRIKTFFQRFSGAQ